MESNEQISYTRNTDKVFEVFQSLRNDDFLCDVILKADNGYTVNAHKVVLAAACPYFLAMFSHFKEREKKHIIIKELDPTALKILINYMYTGQILVTEENVQILLAGSTLLQLHSIQEVCCDLLKRILHPTNCSDIWTLADLYSCQEFLPICESYIKQHFSEVVKSDEFLSLSFDQFFKLISSDELTILSEEIVLKCVVKWVNHLPSSRKDVLPKLIAQIRFLLMSKEFGGRDESEFHKSVEAYCPSTGVWTFIADMHIRRANPSVFSLNGLLLVMGGYNDETSNEEFLEIYNPKTNTWKINNEPAVNNAYRLVGIACIIT
ncbi:BTB/POZ domain,SKP1/BTB/POZ domain,Kelch repeat type 1,Galactose oxidase, beta-propeller,BTB/Kelch- [Cinara cedri]|uniref:BTB/POZ domain,SKP1/BTB/POZ domain,Kelch repeat type 1,Galactose oxidase, beta-propeller,BTB/Kelch n=1 Tax=Cinara cedri TaxID=506608 RepID=A0A5E4MDM7_9HEMI|nr:BTB/POZ domain,SKP1/BTB/POZ domain,Kelch repeat type 1,Galactose oxidase, beta-propeller,BTB/Kelch- [Cinara cedri]